MKQRLSASALLLTVVFASDVGWQNIDHVFIQCTHEIQIKKFHHYAGNACIEFWLQALIIETHDAFFNEVDL